MHINLFSINAQLVPLYKLLIEYDYCHIVNLAILFSLNIFY